MEEKYYPAALAGAFQNSTDGYVYHRINLIIKTSVSWTEKYQSL